MYSKSCTPCIVSIECVLKFRSHILVAGFDSAIFVCLFGFFAPFKNFSLIWRHHNCRCRATNFDLCSWPLRSDGSLACHTYCVKGTFYMVISNDLWHSHLLQSISQWSCHYPFWQLRSVTTSGKTPISCMLGKCSIYWANTLAILLK